MSKICGQPTHFFRVTKRARPSHRLDGTEGQTRHGVCVSKRESDGKCALPPNECVREIIAIPARPHYSGPSPHSDRFRSPPKTVIWEFSQQCADSTRASPNAAALKPLLEQYSLCTILAAYLRQFIGDEPAGVGRSFTTGHTRCPCLSRAFPNDLAPVSAENAP